MRNKAQNETKNEKTIGICTVFGQERLRVTCVERKYKISNSKIGFIVVAKKELDENTTQELLHEDMELKTFLENYEIADIVPVSVGQEPVDTADGKVPGRISSIASIMKKKNGISSRNNNVRVENDCVGIKNDNKPIKSGEKLVGNSNASKDVKNEAIKRRGLFDTLGLQETFVIKDYKKALEKMGIITTNTAMPYDDLGWLEKQGKVVRIGKGERGAVSFMIKRKEAEIVIQ
jgi:hypothetical protein